MSKSGPASVEFRAVVKRYGAVRAVDDINFIIEPGKLVTLLGPSGCGKTTTLRLIAGLEIATEGRILIGGKDVTLLSAAERDVSMVFQSYALFPHMSVFDNVAYGLTVQGLPKTQIRDMVTDKLGLVGLAGLEHRAPSELSGGQQQRVAVARALVREPELVIADHPTSLQDAAGAELVCSALAEATVTAGVIVLGRDPGLRAIAERRGWRQLGLVRGLLKPLAEIDSTSIDEVLLATESAPAKVPEESVPNIVPFPISARTAGVA